MLFVLGLVGAVLPFVPGPPLILAGAFLYALTTDFSPVGFGRLVILTVLTGFALVLHYVGSALGTRRYGGSVWGMAGALVGAVVGLFFGLLGLVLGPVAGELVRGASLEGSVRSGLGAFIGILFGVVGNVSLGLVMIALFLWWVWRG